MRQFFVVIAAFMVGGCNATKTLDGAYYLHSGEPALQRVTLEIQGTRISGQGPCNRYFGAVTHSTSDIHNVSVGPIASTKMACPHLSAERDFFQDLQSVTTVEIVQDSLMLKTSSAKTLIFEHR